MSALPPAFFILYLESYISRLNELLRHDLTLSVGEPDNAAAQTGAGTSFGANGNSHYMSSTASTYFLRLNNSETFVELVGARPLHLLSQTVLPLKSPTGAFIAPLRCANASLPWQAEQAHHTTSKEKQSVPDGERPVVHIVIVRGFFRVRPGGRTLFF